jgi:hypothetical protein
MKLSIISAVALTAAMLASPSVLAQDTMAAPTMIGSQSVSEADLPEVQAQCDKLAGIDRQSEAASDASETSDAETPDGTDQALTMIDLELITIEDCKTAGLAQ